MAVLSSAVAGIAGSGSLLWRLTKTPDSNSSQNAEQFCRTSKLEGFESSGLTLVDGLRQNGYLSFTIDKTDNLGSVVVETIDGETVIKNPPEDVDPSGEGKLIVGFIHRQNEYNIIAKSPDGDVIDTAKVWSKCDHDGPPKLPDPPYNN